MGWATWPNARLLSSIAGFQNAIFCPKGTTFGALGHPARGQECKPLIQTKRIYETPSPDDGYRVLVDRIWPRGVSKSAARLDDWMKDITPSPELRMWFGHDPARWPEFKAQYLIELQGTKQKACFKDLQCRAAERVITLLYAAKDDHHNHALILLDALTAD